MSALEQSGITMTPWVWFTELDMKTVPTGPGTYAVARDRPISRLNGVDDDGVLTFGESGGLRTRLRDFWRCATVPGDEGHMAGWRFAFLRMAEVCPIERLRVRWAPANDKRHAKVMEGKLLSVYLGLHKEQPPLNYSSNWIVE